MEGEFSSWINLQTRYYTDSGAYVDEKVFPAVAAQFEYQAYVGDADQLSAALFMRYDQEDEERRYLDVRELLWRHDNEYGRIQAGVGQVAWGVNEFFKITDVVNQKDRAELPLPKKLGQPLIGVLSIGRMTWLSCTPFMMSEKPGIPENREDYVFLF